MGKISILTKEQKEILSFIKETPYISSQFYFTGGTALSEYHLHHRYSDDLDFFSEKPIDAEKLFTIVTNWAQRLHATVKTRLIDNRMYICIFTFKNKSELKIDLCYYDHLCIEKKSIINGIQIDSEFDIAVNKLVTISQRSSVKDFVDLYYLLPKYGYWDLAHAAKQKFLVEVDPVLFGSDLLIVENFDHLPRMIKKLTLKELKSFFREKAIEIGKTGLKK